jgi:two-component system, cell cycle sensor histidine kinase and response regulator CckA
MAQISILLVEDDPGDVRRLHEALAGLNGNRPQITSVRRLDNALAVLSREHYDVALLDLSLPDSEGFGTLTQMRTFAPDMPVVVLTDCDDHVFGTRAVQEGAQDYLVKGAMDGNLLMRAVHYAIERARTLGELRRGEERYRNLVEQASDGIFVFDAQGRVVDANRAGLAMLGYSAEALWTLPLAELVVADKEGGNAFDLRGLVPGEHALIECRVRRLDGSIFDAEISAKKLADARVQGIVRDVTERKATMDALRTTTSQLRNLFDNLDQMFLSVDAVEAQILQISPACEKIYGLPRQAFLDNARLMIEMVHPDDRAAVEHTVRELCAGRSAISEHRIVRPDGEVRWVEAHGKPTTEATGRVTRIDAILSDISERKKADEVRSVLFQVLESTGQSDNLEELLGIFRRLLHRLIDTTNFFVALYDPENDTYSFPIFADEHDDFGLTTRALPFSFTDFVRRTGNALLVDEEQMREMADGGVVRMVGAPSRVWMGVPLKTARGVIGTMALQSYTDSSLYTEQDLELMQVISGHLAVAIERKRATDALSQSEQQLRQAQKMEAVGRLAGGVAHDFNNLLTTILGHSEMALLKLGDNDPLRDGIQEVMRAADRAASLTRQLLAFSRKQVLEPRVLDLNAIVRDMEKLMRRLIGEDIDLVTRLERGLGSVKADPGQVEQVLMNLVVNARDAMPEGGMLVIETANVDLDEQYMWIHKEVTPGPHVLLSVTDSGTGMTPDIVSHIFEPFFTTKEHGKGTGLGLSTVYGIVKQSGGHIWVYSEPGRGTSFKIYLPLVAQSPEAMFIPAPEMVSGGTETILLVEDEAPVRVLVRRILEEKGFTVCEAQHPEEAASIAGQDHRRIDLLITDVIMPRTSGDQLARRIHALRPEMKVLFMSGYTDEALGNHGVLEAGTSFLAKPFSAEALVRKVRKLLDTPVRPV